jgi:hypothetical protein
MTVRVSNTEIGGGQQRYRFVRETIGMAGRKKSASVRDFQIKHFIQDYFARRFEAGESDEKIAASLKPALSKPQVVNARKHGDGIGPKTIEAVANKLFDGKQDALAAAAAELAKRDGVKLDITALTNDPELAATLAFLASPGPNRVPEEFLRPWATARNDAGWKKMTRFDYMQMIYGAWLGKLTPATDRLEADRTRKLPPKKS